MKTIILTCSLLLGMTITLAQTVEQRIQKAYAVFEKDPQLKYALSSLYVIDAKTGETIFEKNSRVGLAPASTQKIITTASAFEILGKNFTFRTEFGYEGSVVDGKLDGHFYIAGSGDPTLGSWRWMQTKEENVIGRIARSVLDAGIRSAPGRINFIRGGWDSQSIPNGWIWEDIGNYYGAGASNLNWRENQYDVILRSGNKVGDPVSIVGYVPEPAGFNLLSEVKSAAKGTRDNAYIYLPLNSTTGIVRGTIPANQSSFRISGSFPDPSAQLRKLLFDSLAKSIDVIQEEVSIKPVQSNETSSNTKSLRTKLHTEISPPLDSIIYWFNQKSVNLYGEALVKAISFKKYGMASTDSGVSVIRNFWKQKKIDENEINIIDGSGLSPQNRVTTHAQVEILKFAMKQDWFASFYNSLPRFNEMKLKSGTIRGSKGFCGYHRSGKGQEYIISFLVNNYNGPSGTLADKMYIVLDVLK